MGNRFCFESLRDFIAHLEVAGELERIKASVSSELEITEITDRVSKSAGGGKALLFENVDSGKTPVLINAFGSERRMATALGVENLDEIGADIQALLDMKPPTTFGEKLGFLPELLRLSKCAPKLVDDRRAPCQEVVLLGEDIDLGKWPILKCWPDDGGRFITLPSVFTKSVDGKRNVGVYRLQVFNARTTGMHWHIHKDSALFYDEYKKQNRNMEVAIAIGCDPATVYAATAPLPPGLDELLLAGFIRGKSVELVKCQTIDMEVPRTAEIVIEGYVTPGESRTEGPFGDHTGYYSLSGQYPVFHVTAITHRKNPIYLTTIVGKPPMEDCYMGKATERIFLPLLRTVNPEIVDYDLPWEGVFHNCVIVSFNKRYPAQANKLMSSLWGAGQMSFAKMILAVDADIDAHNYDLVARTALNRLDVDGGYIVPEGTLDVLDHSAPKPLHGSKLGIDATKPVIGEEREKPESWANRDLAPFTKAASENKKVVAHAVPYTDVANPLAIIAVDKQEAFDGRKTAQAVAVGDTANAIRIYLVVDGDVDPKEYRVALWKFFNNVDPSRDIFHENQRLFIDATKKLPEEGHKREWPDELVMSDEVVEKVDTIWPGLGL